MKEVIANLVLEAMVSLILAGIAWAAVALALYVRPMINAYLDKAKKEAEAKNCEIAAMTLETAKKLLNGMLYNAVAAMEQTKAMDIRDKVKAGVLDRSKLEELSLEVLASVKQQIAPDMIRVLQQYVTDLDAYMNDIIESSLLDIKSLEPVKLQEGVAVLDTTDQDADRLAEKVCSILMEKYFTFVDNETITPEEAGLCSDRPEEPDGEPIQ